MMGLFVRKPIIAGLIGGTGAVVSGGMWMAIAGAPMSYIVVNGVALAIGIAVTGLLLNIPPRASGALAMAAAFALLATGLFGSDVETIRRWVALPGGLQLQPAMLLLPAMLVGYARAPHDRWRGAAVIVAAFAIMIQPDRSMAMPLVGVALLVWWQCRGHLSLAILAAAIVALAVTIWRDDPLRPVRYVEQVLIDGWNAGAGQTLLLGIGAVAMLAPLFAARHYRDAGDRRAALAFGVTWASLLFASVIGAHPTPLLGYGASAIIGYVMALAALSVPPVARHATTTARPDLR
jgi:hypothetical protein